MSAQRSALPDADPTALPSVGDAAKVVGWGLVFWGGVQLAAAVFAMNATAMVAAQAAVAEWGAGRLAVAWSNPLAPAPAWASIGRRVARGAAFGFAAAGLVVLFELALRTATLVRGSPALGSLIVGLLISALAAVRDELLLRGVVLRATRGLLPTWAAVLACGGASTAARIGMAGGDAITLACEALRGVALGGLWVRDRGAWMAWAANATWMWSEGSLFRGALLDVRSANEPDASVSAFAVLAVAAVAALLGTTGRPAEPPQKRKARQSG